jgi:hypothetical protein
VKDPALLTSLKVGQEISADLKAMTVTLPAAKPGAKPVQVRILKAKPTGAMGSPAAGTAKPGGKKSIASNFSVLTSGVPALNPLLVHPDLVPDVIGHQSMCSWNESQGQTCESECPPLEVTLGVGTKNISPRPLSGPVRIRVLAHPSGNVVKDWTVTDVAGSGGRYPGWLKFTIVRCHPEGQMTMSQPPPPNHKLVVQTNATEADKNNNTRLIHIGPSTQLGP